jgi:molybdopterin converting factor small subunit
MVTVVLYGPVREAVGEKRFAVGGETVGGVLAALSDDHPTLGERLFGDHADADGAGSDGETEGRRLRSQVQVFVDGRKAGTLDGLATRLDGDETVQVTEAMSGG